MTDIYSCSECKKEYKQRKSLVKHINSLHTNIVNVNDHIIKSITITKKEENKHKDIQPQIDAINEYNKRMNETIEVLNKKITKLESTKEKRFCIACWEYESSFALSPCGHKMLCGTCAAQLVMQPSPMCPICRSRVNDIIQIWDTSIRESDTL